MFQLHRHVDNTELLQLKIPATWPLKRQAAFLYLSDYDNMHYQTGSALYYVAKQSSGVEASAVTSDLLLRRKRDLGWQNQHKVPNSLRQSVSSGAFITEDLELTYHFSKSNNLEM